MKTFTDKFGPWAIVTVASSGMGVNFAKLLAQHRLNIVLVARREDRLRRIARDLEQEYSIQTRVVADNQTRLQLFALAYNLANFLRRLAVPRSIRRWSLTTSREKRRWFGMPNT